jgi:hypothetical protein
VWDVDPQKIPFKLSADEDRREAFSVLLDANASSGSQPVRIHFAMANGAHEFSVYRELHVGLGDLEVELDSMLDEHGNLVVEQHLTNQSDRLVSFNCLLTIPTRRRERRQVFNLGRTRTKVTFVLPDGEALIGQTLWLRMEEIGGARILNHQITAHD